MSNLRNSLRNFFNNPDLGSLLFRLMIGLSMAFAHGMGKIPPGEQMITGVTSMGFPLPVVFAWAAALTEFAGGLLIAIGLFTRYAALFLGVTMSVAVLVVHGADPFNIKEMAFLYLAACVILGFQGAGKYSLDRMMRKV